MLEDKSIEAKHIKHESLDNAIENVSSILHTLEGLYDEILNVPPQDRPAQPREEASLGSVLEKVFLIVLIVIISLKCYIHIFVVSMKLE
jgi:hypothetical protein